MSVTVQDQALPLSVADINRLWELVRTELGIADRDISVRSVGRERMRELYRAYGDKDKATDALTFVYPLLPGETTQSCDVCLCLPVVEEAAQERGVPVAEQFLGVLTHALLHAADMDHERSKQEAARMQKMEQIILGKYRSVALQ